MKEPLDVPCPTCAARPGQPCFQITNSDHTARSAHAAREHNAKHTKAAAEIPAQWRPLLPVTVPCDKCHAEPGQPCRNSAGQKTANHATRLHAARELGRYQAAHAGQAEATT